MVFRNFAKYLVDFFKFSRFDLQAVNRLVSMEHLEYLEQAERLGRGVIMITAHIGNDYKRVRIGIGHPGDKTLVYPYVLGDFFKSEVAWVVAAMAPATFYFAGSLAYPGGERFVLAWAAPCALLAAIPPPRENPIKLLVTES